MESESIVRMASQGIASGLTCARPLATCKATSLRSAQARPVDVGQCVVSRTDLVDPLLDHVEG